MTNRSPAFQCYPKDLLVDTTMLSTVEFGAYWRLCCYAWKGVAGLPQCALPDDDLRLSRMAGLAKREWLAIRDSVLEYFDLEDNLWWHPRLRKELQKQIDRRTRLSEAGKAGAKARYGQATSQAIASPKPGHGPAMQSPVAPPKHRHSLPSATPSAVANSGKLPPPTPPTRSEVEKSARELIREHLLLGDEVAQANGHRLELDDQLAGWKRAAKKHGPERLNLGIPHLRRLLPPDMQDQPVGFGFLHQYPGLLEQAVNEAEKRQPVPELKT